MKNGQAVRGSHSLIRLCLGDHLIQFCDERSAPTVQTAVSLMRSIYEDHFVDPEYQNSLSFHGYTLAGTHDFTVVHRDGHAILSDFTFPVKAPSVVSLPIQTYAQKVVSFGEQMLDRGANQGSTFPDWRLHYEKSLREQLETLLKLSHRFLDGGCKDHPAFCEAYQAVHGQLKRPLELLVHSVRDQVTPWRPVTVEGRILFGPLRARQRLPMRLNGGDMIVGTVHQFTQSGAHLTLEGVGSGGVRPGDRLYGLQMFYP